MKTIDEYTTSPMTHIELLVDDELSFEDRREFLNQLDTDYPEQWRTLALAFVEKQVLAEAFRKQEKKVVPMPLRHVKRWAAVACVAALGFFVGMKVDQSNQKVATSPEVPSHHVATTKGASEALPLYGRLKIPGTVVNGESQHLPVYDARESGMRRSALISTRNLKRINELISSRGYNVSLQTEYLATPLNEKEQLVVPVDHIKINQTKKQEVLSDETL